MEYSFERLTAEEYNALRRAVGWAEYPSSQVESALRQSVTLCAVEKGRAVEMGRLTGDGIYYLLADVVVDPIYQGCSIGRNIVVRLLEHAQRQAPAGSRVTVQLTAAPGKEGFCRSCGFQALPDEGCGMRRVLGGTAEQQPSAKGKGSRDEKRLPGVQQK